MADHHSRRNSNASERVGDYCRAMVSHAASPASVATFGGMRTLRARRRGDSNVLQRGDGLAVHRCDGGAILVLEAHGRVVGCGAASDNRFVSIVTLENRKIVHWCDYADSLAAMGGSTACASSLSARRSAIPSRRQACPRCSLRMTAWRTSVVTGFASGAEMRIQSTARFGTLAAFHLVDDRQYGDPRACTKGGKHGSSTVDPATCAE